MNIDTILSKAKSNDSSALILVSNGNTVGEYLSADGNQKTELMSVTKSIVIRWASIVSFPSFSIANRWLQDRQVSRKLDTSLRPPKQIGWMWSYCRARVDPQRTQCPWSRWYTTRFTEWGLAVRRCYWRKHTCCAVVLSTFCRSFWLGFLGLRSSIAISQIACSNSQWES